MPRYARTLPRTRRASSFREALVGDVRKIAVLRSNSLGDYVFALPALEALRRSYPRAEIVLLGKRWHAEFLARRPGPVDRVVVVPYTKRINEEQGKEAEDPAEQREFFDRMAGERFDIGVQLYGGGRYSNPFMKRLRPRVSAGMRANDAPPLDRWVPYVYYHPEILRYLEVVSLVGARPVSLEPRLRVTPEDRAEALPFLAPLNRPVAVLHPGGTDPRRHWPPIKFALAGDALDRAGAAVVLTGSSEEAPLVESVLRSMRAGALNLCGRLSLGGLAGLLSLSRLAVSNDTGPLHLARAVGAATVGVYWVGNLINAGPVTSARHRSHLSWRLNCPECGKNCIETTCTHSSSFVADVPADEVIASSLELFSSSFPESW